MQSAAYHGGAKADESADLHLFPARQLSSEPQEVRYWGLAM